MAGHNTERENAPRHSAKRTRSTSADAKRASQVTKKQKKAEKHKQPEGFFQRILHTFTSQSQQLSTDEESSQASANERASEQFDRSRSEEDGGSTPGKNVRRRGRPLSDRSLNAASTDGSQDEFKKPAARRRLILSGTSESEYTEPGVSDAQDQSATSNSSSKRRGRPPKRRNARSISDSEATNESTTQYSSLQEFTEASLSENNATDESTSKPKKKLGRPRKYPVGTVRTVESEPRQKKKLGRPRKYPVGTVKTAESEPREKKKLGRPRKYPVETEPREKKKIGRPRIHPIPTEPREKKKIGRPRIHPIPTEPREKRPRGRPRKITSDASNNEQMKVGRPLLSDEHPPEKKKMGRPRIHPPKPPGPKRPIGRPRKNQDDNSVLKAFSTEHYGNEASVTDDPVARESKSKRKGKGVAMHDDDFLLSEPDSSDEADDEMKEKAMEDDSDDDQETYFKALYDPHTQQYYKLGKKGRINIGGPGYKQKTTGSEKANQSKKKRATRSEVHHEEDSEHEYEDSDEFPLLDSNYRLVHILRGPSKLSQAQKDGSRDTDIWAAEFEPAIDNASSNIVALCGADTVELIDAAQGRVVKKYSHMEQKEEFFCLAWTTLTSLDSWSQEKSYNILAAAGKLGTIKLFNPTQSECYRYLFGHSKQISRLAFSKAKRRWLLSASLDLTIRLWDIGSAESKIDSSVCLAKFSPGHSSVPTALCISNDMRWLLAGCDDGQMYRYNLGTAAINRFRRGKEAAMAKFKPGHKRRGQGIIQYSAPEVVYPAGEEWHESYVDDILMVEKVGVDRQIYNAIISRASGDEEIVMWNPLNSTDKDADIFASYDWPEGPVNCLRMKLLEDKGRKAIVSGDCNGNIRIYDVGSGKRSKDLPDGSKDKSETTRIISHSQSKGIIRDITVSPNMEYIVTVDGANRVYIWRGH
ncbi:hypothetical protein INT43_003782 [Umbelopsis isabellina]|uniref:Leucine-rich repeat and WD repeat-containing protein 1 WD domain-containing protein n=1 Tax=Mortierella isabellina TaxID=91625 RepID=A0A8H7PU86_MORIS|nr:hypothetical protein INT43_003782 [Umbelopsis isabellina]